MDEAPGGDPSRPAPLPVVTEAEAAAEAATSLVLIPGPKATELPEPAPARRVKTPWAALRSRSSIPEVSTRAGIEDAEVADAETKSEPEVAVEAPTEIRAESVSEVAALSTTPTGPVPVESPAAAEAATTPEPNTPLSPSGLSGEPAPSPDTEDATVPTTEKSFEWEPEAPPQATPLRPAVDAAPPAFSTAPGDARPATVPAAPTDDRPESPEAVKDEPTLVEQQDASSEPLPEKPDSASAAKAPRDGEMWVFVPKPFTEHESRRLSLIQRIIRWLKALFSTLFG